MRERELKLALPGRFALPTLILDGQPIESEPLPELDLRASYHDTEDLRLARHGVTLRYRTGEPDGPIWTLKLPLADGVLDRAELNFAGERREVPAPAELVTAFARTADLLPVATLHTRRHRWRVSRDGVPLAEVDDDEVSVIEGRRIVARFRELEIEARSDDTPLAILADQLMTAGATPAEPIPKVVRALGSRATAAPDVVVPDVDPAGPISAVVAAAIADAMQRIMRNDALARLGDVEAIHQLRVATRRLRSDLRMLAPVLDAGWVTRVNGPLRHAAGRLGAVRDLDVLTARLAHDADAIGEREVLAPFFDELNARRQTALDEMLAALRDRSYVELLDELVAAAGRPPVTGDANAPAAERGSQLAREAWRRLERRADGVEPDSADGAFHAVRIAAKRARYAAEAVARSLPSGRAAQARRFANRLGDVQDALGDHQDGTVVAAELRAAVATRPGQTDFALAAGRLLERQSSRGAASRSAFASLWRDLRRGRWRRWT